MLFLRKCQKKAVLFLQLLSSKLFGLNWYEFIFFINIYSYIFKNKYWFSFAYLQKRKHVRNSNNVAGEKKATKIGLWGKAVGPDWNPWNQTSTNWNCLNSEINPQTIWKSRGRWMRLQDPGTSQTWEDHRFLRKHSIKSVLCLKLYFSEQRRFICV